MEVGSSSLPGTTEEDSIALHSQILHSSLLILHYNGGLAQLARAPALQAGGQRFESVILHTFQSFAHHAEQTEKRSLTCCYRQNCRKENFNTAESMGYVMQRPLGILHKTKAKVRKGVRRMPRLTEAMKDVISCDKLRGGANDL